MRLWNSRRYRKPSRVSTFLGSSLAHDFSDDHAFSTSSNGYGPQVIPDAGFRPNHLVTHSSEHEFGEGRNPNPRRDSPVSDSSSIRRKQLGPWSTSTASEPSSTDAPPKDTTRNYESIPQVTRNGLWSWIPYIAHSADDTDVQSQVKEVFLFAEQFVMNYYCDRVPIDEIPMDALSKVNRSRLLPMGQLQTYLIESSYQTTLIKHVLISLMLDLISFDSVGSEGSLLPQEFRNYIALAKAMTRSQPAEIPHLQPALSTYRVLSTYIYSNVDDDQSYLNEKQQISEAIAAAFRSTFEQWLEKTKSQKDWESSFHLLVDKTASLGVFLFSQPSVFFFDWEMTSEDRSARLIPVSPRFLRVFDDEAQFREVSDHMIPMKCARVFKGLVSEMQEERDVVRG